MHLPVLDPYEADQEQQRWKDENNLGEKTEPKQTHP